MQRTRYNGILAFRRRVNLLCIIYLFILSGCYLVPVSVALSHAPCCATSLSPFTVPRLK